MILTVGFFVDVIYKRMEGTSLGHLLLWCGWVGRSPWACPYAPGWEAGWHRALLTLPPAGRPDCPLAVGVEWDSSSHWVSAGLPLQPDGAFFILLCFIFVYACWQCWLQASPWTVWHKWAKKSLLMPCILQPGHLLLPALGVLLLVVIQLFPQFGCIYGGGAGKSESTPSCSGVKSFCFSIFLSYFNETLKTKTFIYI